MNQNAVWTTPIRGDLMWEFLCGITGGHTWSKWQIREHIVYRECAHCSKIQVLK